MASAAPGPFQVQISNPPIIISMAMLPAMKRL